jgi:hypothetical protein
MVPDDEKPDAARVALISERFWARAYGRNAGAIGDIIALSGVPVTVIGVLPASFTGVETGRAPDLRVQMGPQPGPTPWGVRPEGAPPAVYASRDRWRLQVIGRLKPGVTVEQARAEFGRLVRKGVLEEIMSPPPADRVPQGLLNPALQGLRLPVVSRRYLTSLNILMVVGGLVLLIACANLATQLLARAPARRREMSVRLAMGAPRSRLVRQLLTESGIYAAAGAGGSALHRSLGRGRRQPAGLGRVPLRAEPALRRDAVRRADTHGRRHDHAHRGPRRRLSACPARVAPRTAHGAARRVEISRNFSCRTSVATEVGDLRLGAPRFLWSVS